jgi:DNA-binding MarR family transcriptional regulator
MAIAASGPVTTSELARGVYLSPSTIVGIVDRLEREGFVARERGKLDRRVVSLSITEQGRNFLRRAPSPLQDLFAERLQELSHDEQVNIAAVIEKVAELMGAERINAAPLLQPGDISGDLYS